MYISIVFLNLGITWIQWRKSRSEDFYLLLKFWMALGVNMIAHLFSNVKNPLFASYIFAISFFLTWFLSQLLARLSQVEHQRKLILRVIGTAIPLSTVLYFLDAPAEFVLLPITLGCGFSCLYTSLQVMTKRWGQLSSTLRGFSFTMFLLGLHTVDYAYAFAHQKYIAAGFTLAIGLMVALTMFCPMAILEKTADEKERLELTVKYHAQLTQAAKYSALGEMAGGVAHEINNPLQILSGHLDLVKRRLGRGSLGPAELEDKIEKMSVAANRISRITRGLIAFSRPDSDTQRQVTLSQLVSETLILCAQELERAGVRLDYEVSDDITVLCRPAEIQQVLFNLINNAKEASQAHDEKWIRIQAKPADSKVVVAVTDSGEGIRPEVLEKIFQPFFTTKDFGKGTGLGLAIAKGIIEGHGGQLWYDLDGDHTRFSFSLRG